MRPWKGVRFVFWDECFRSPDKLLYLTSPLSGNSRVPRGLGRRVADAAGSDVRTGKRVAGGG